MLRHPTMAPLPAASESYGVAAGSRSPQEAVTFGPVDTEHTAPGGGLPLEAPSLAVSRDASLIVGVDVHTQPLALAQPSGRAPSPACPAATNGSADPPELMDSRNVGTAAGRAWLRLRRAAVSKAQSDAVFHATRPPSVSVSITDVGGNRVAGFRVANVVEDLCRVESLLRAYSRRAAEARSLQIASKMSARETKQFNDRWGPEVVRVSEAAQPPALGAGGASVAAAFGAAEVDRVLASAGPKPVRATTWSSYMSVARDYLFFCNNYDFTEHFLQGFSPTAAVVVLASFIEHQAHWRGPGSVERALAALKKWFLKCHVPEIEANLWFSDQRVVAKAREMGPLLSDADRHAARLEELKDQVSVDFLWVAKSIFGLLYPPGADCPWEDGGRATPSHDCS